MPRFADGSGKMNYAEIKWTDIANGEGVRISLFVSGCTHHCKNCFNEIAWDFSYGKPFDEEIRTGILEGLGQSFISGLSLLGGEPMEPVNQKALLPFVRQVRERYPEKKYLVLYRLYVQSRHRAFERIPRQYSGDERIAVSVRRAGGRTVCRGTEKDYFEIPGLVQSARSGHKKITYRKKGSALS